MMEFTFQSPGEIVFARGAIDQLPARCAAFGRRLLLCLRGDHFQNSSHFSRLRSHLDDLQMELTVFDLQDGEPQAGDIGAGAALARKSGAEIITAIGGGSCIDTGKAVAALATNPGEVMDYLEGVGTRVLRLPPLPFVAVPTTAGTGAEATQNAVIISPLRQAKKSLRSALLLPRLALLDPLLTLSMPQTLTAETGMDAVTQLIESYTSVKAQPMPQALAVKGLRLAGSCLHRAFANGSDAQAREGMLLASLLSGLALANSGLGAAHGIAAALGAHLHIPHGRACAMLLPAVMAANRSVCTAGYADVYRALSGDAGATDDKAADLAVNWVLDLTEKLAIPKKLSMRVNEPLIKDLVRDSRGSSMNGNPRALTDDEIETIIRGLL